MTDQTKHKLNLAIAKARGWKRYEGASLINYMWAPGHFARVVPKWYRGDPGNGLDIGPSEPCMELPDYCSSLDAMHEAEAYLERTTGMLSVGCLIRDYILHLMQICLPNPDKKLWSNGDFLGSWGDCVFAYTATAEQRALAFCRTMGIEVEVEE